MPEPELPEAGRDVVATVARVIASALGSWRRTLRLCLILAAIALIVAAWRG